MRASPVGARPRLRRRGGLAVMGCSPFILVLLIVDLDRDCGATGHAQDVSRADASGRCASARDRASYCASRGCCRGGHAASADPALFRIFLKDGTALASYGEFARVGDRVVFTMPWVNTVSSSRRWARARSTGRAPMATPTGSAPDITPRRTANRTTRYMSTRIARALTEIAQATNPSDQLRQAEDARRELAGVARASFWIQSRRDS